MIFVSMPVYIEIPLTVLVLAAVAFLFGLLLAVAAKKFAVNKDPRIDQICEHLAGANCGGCGYSGCAAYAKAIVEDGALVSLCSAGGGEVAKKIGEIMGVTVEEKEPMVARVFCKGATDKANVKLQYKGAKDCFAAKRMAGGPKECQYGCIGLGSCVSVCKFDAIHIIDGVAVVDEDKCTSCGACVQKCVQGIIRIVPKSKTHAVLCSNHDKGAVAKNLCKVSCLGCKICEKNCPEEAVKVENNLSVIDYEKCINCGICAEKCPKKIII